MLAMDITITNRLFAGRSRAHRMLRVIAHARVRSRMERGLRVSADSAKLSALQLIAPIIPDVIEHE